jgi:hypothetical protein
VIAEPADRKLIDDLQLLRILFRQTCRCQTPPQTAATPYFLTSLLSLLSRDYYA